MGMTIIQKIIARASGNEEVAVGDKVWCAIDLAAMRDFGGPNVVLDYREMFGDRPVKDPDKVAMTFTCQHVTPRWRTTRSCCVISQARRGSTCSTWRPG